MRNNRLFVLVALLLGLSVGTLPAQSSGQATNANAIALLRWYPANTVTQCGMGGSQPSGIVFDSQNMWVAGAGSQSLSKIRANDGTLVGTFHVGHSPDSVAFDGANVWVTNSSDGTVSKVRASDGTVLGTFTAGTTPLGIVFDGSNIWIALQGQKLPSEGQA